MSFLTIVQAASQFITGQFGALLITTAVAIFGGSAMFHHQWGRFWSVLAGGAVLLSAAWIVQTFYAA